MTHRSFPQKTSSLHGMSPYVAAFSGSARAGNKARCGLVVPATRSKSPGGSQNIQQKCPIFYFQPKKVTFLDHPKIHLVVKMDRLPSIVRRLSQMKWSYVNYLHKAQAPVATAATSFSDRLGPWFNGSTPISRKRIKGMISHLKVQSE